MENDSQRAEYLIGRIMAGQATRQEQAELLVAIYRSLWTVQNLEKRIGEVHTRLCAQCELRKLAAAKLRPSGFGDLISAVAGNRLPWLIVGILALIVATLLGIDISPLLKGG